MGKAGVNRRRILIGLIAVACVSASNAANKEVQYAGTPAWVIAVPAPTDSPTPDGASYRVVYSDNQVRFGPDGVEAFQAYRLKLLRPDALAAGNISLTWSPDAGEARVHYVRIIRNKTVTDVLKSTKFQVLQRENFLEKAALNGELTATLQAPGLEVGDELEVAATIRHKDPTLGDHLFGFALLPATGQPGAFRLRMVLPTDPKLHSRASADVTGLSETTVSGQTVLVYELHDPHTAVITDGAPARINVRRMIEVSDFDSWAEVSRRIWPLFEKASSLAPQSPIRKEIARIGASDTDPKKRVAAALQLVQDRIRYVYIGLNGGNFMPASADETWQRRFGDCKAKTALLLAILRELGIRGEAVMVNSLGGDGLNERLPTPGLFDHVVVRVNLGDKAYWLDGSRLGDRSLDPSPRYRWVLPLRSDGADLERMSSDPPKSPDSTLVMDVDSTKGFEQKATIKMQQVLRGDSALDARSKIMAMSAEDADRTVRAYWRQTNGWIEPDTVSWRYDEQRGTLLLTLEGKGKMDWEGKDTDARALSIPGAGFTPPAEYHRSKEQDQTAPWLTEYPAFRCWVTAIHLPDGGSKWKWDYDSDPIDTHLGGVDYWRLADLRDGVIRTVMSKRFDVPEITAEQADEVNRGLPTFNNNMSRVYQIALNDRESNHKRLSVAPFQADTDWTSPDTPCVPQTQLSWTPAPTAAIIPSIRSLGGVTLGLTPSELMHAKGAPAKKIDSTHWIYNSVDAAHDGLLDVLFSDDAVEESRQVRMVIFSGSRGAEPAGMPKLLGRTRQSLVRQYGEPVSEASAGPHGQYLYFHNGIEALVVSNTTVSYGIWDVAKWAAK
jgi:Domain of Unknown Function with PDB structure (DUF3857)/Transglutaminase-like superfamily